MPICQKWCKFVSMKAFSIFYLTPTLVGLIGIAIAHGPSPPPTACRYPTHSLMNLYGSNQA